MIKKNSHKLALILGKKTKSFEKLYNSISKEEVAAANKVLSTKVLSGFVGRAGSCFLGGTYVRELEDDFKRYLHAAHAVSFNSATTALQAAVAAIGVGPGDEVITSPITMSASASAILFNNAIPVFADIEPDTYCISAKTIEKKISKRTKAIMVVNLFGGSCDLDALLKLARKYKLRVIEDNAQGAGGKYKNKFLGTIGDVGVISLNVHKTIQSGEGGILVTNNDRIAFRAQLVRNHGEVAIDDLAPEGIFEPIVGSNFRLSEISAAIAAAQLKKLDVLNSVRVKNARYLTRILPKFKWLVPYFPALKNRTIYQYPFRFLEEKIGFSRATFAKAMTAEGYPVYEGYQKPIYYFPLYQKRRIYENSRYPFFSKDFKTNVDYSMGICPEAEKMFEGEVLTTTIFLPPNSKVEIDGFISSIGKIEKNKDSLKDYETKN